MKSPLAHVMRQIAEKNGCRMDSSPRVLNNRAAVCISLRRAQFFGVALGNLASRAGFNPSSQAESMIAWWESTEYALVTEGHASIATRVRTPRLIETA